MLCWYRRLLQLRKEIPAITQGHIISQQAQDETGLIRITRCLNGQQVTLVFCSKEISVELSDLAGRTDLLSGEVFDGNIHGITALVLQ